MYLAIGVRADERDRGDLRMVEQRIDAFAVAVDDVEHAVGQARFEQQFAEPHARRAALFRTASGRTCCRR